MSIQYDPQIDSESDSSDVELPGPASAARPRPPTIQEYSVFSNKWPKCIGILMAVNGVISILLGVTEVIVIPVIQDTTGSLSVIQFNLKNAYGAALWTGFILMLTGCTALRAYLGRRSSTVYRFFSLVLLCVIVYILALVLLILGYSAGVDVKDSFKENMALFLVHTFVVIAVSTGFLLCLSAFVQYYEDVFCGELQLCKKCFHCACPCFCPRATTTEELGQGDASLPSIPI